MPRKKAPQATVDQLLDRQPESRATAPVCDYLLHAANSDTTSKISFFFICIINKVSIHHSSTSTSVIQFTVFLKHAITDLFHSSQSFTWEIIRFNFGEVFITPRRSKFKLKRVDKSTYSYLHPYNIHTK